MFMRVGDGSSSHGTAAEFVRTSRPFQSIRKDYQERMFCWYTGWTFKNVKNSAWPLEECTVDQTHKWASKYPCDYSCSFQTMRARRVFGMVWMKSLSCPSVGEKKENLRKEWLDSFDFLCALCLDLLQKGELPCSHSHSHAITIHIRHNYLLSH